MSCVQLFEDSRRLTGPNVYFSVCGAVLEALAEGDNSARYAVWRENVLQACALLHWPTPEFHQKIHCKGATLGFTAPLDQLYSATEINEWAWLRACNSADMFAPGFLDVFDTNNAFQTLTRLAAAEAEPALMAFISAAQQKHWPVLLDEDLLSIGFGAQAKIWPRKEVPSSDVLNDGSPKHLPIAMVTGSNGKTTSVRLLSAMCRASGLATGHSCTDGLFFNGVLVEADDYSGPAGARATLRHPLVQAAILETARGGLLRRGLACNAADVAMVTNISEDHFGEYGVFSLDDLAQVKLSIAKGLRKGGILVLNAEDPMLVKHGQGKAEQLAWFCADWNNATLQNALANAQAVCGVRDGQLCLQSDGQCYELGAIVNMPISYQGMATYNIENMAGAALTAFLMAVPVEIIAQTLQSFGNNRQDNPGRLQSWQFANMRVLMDYAHNPDGMQGFLKIASAFNHNGRLAVLLGQAGNREDADICKLADAVAEFTPNLVVLKEMAGYERGRQLGEVPAILYQQLLKSGMQEQQLRICLDEVAAVRSILEWAQSDDVLALPVHGLHEREAVQALLDAMHAQDWLPGQALPCNTSSVAAIE